MSDDLLLTFYGDDFTGSTDVLESLSLHGVDTVLFLDEPDSALLADFDDVGAIGVAGRSRRMSPEQMDDELPPVFESLAELGAPLFHYKVCSTFDSSPTTGSIGHAIDLGTEAFDAEFVPVVVAAPSLEPRGRYVIFGNLFATVDGSTYRLDRHPTMSEHPVTPMAEADLTRHLGKQTRQSIGLFDVRSIDGARGDALGREFEAAISRDDIVLLDGLTHEHQRKVGRLIWEHCRDSAGQVFSASSAGLNYALCHHWHETGVVPEPDPPEPAPAVEQIVVVSGSASPVNRDQIGWARQHGFECIRLQTERLVDPDGAAAARQAAIDAGLEAIDAGASPLLFAARGPDDPAIEATRAVASELDIDEPTLGERLGREQGRIARRLLEESYIRRCCVAGGDTSGFVAPHLDVYALEFLASVGPGSPLCTAHTKDSEFDGLELALKGGQVQTTNEDDDYFGVVRQGGVSRPQ